MMVNIFFCVLSLLKFARGISIEESMCVVYKNKFFRSKNSFSPRRNKNAIYFGEHVRR